MEQSMIDAQTEVGFARAVVDEKRGQVCMSLDAHTHCRQVERDDFDGIDGCRRPLAAQLDRCLEAVAVEGYLSSGISTYYCPDDGVEESGHAVEHTCLSITEGGGMIALRLDLSFQVVGARLCPLPLDQQLIQPSNVIDETAGFEPGIRSRIPHTFHFPQPPIRSIGVLEDGIQLSSSPRQFLSALRQPARLFRVFSLESLQTLLGFVQVRELVRQLAALHERPINRHFADGTNRTRPS